MDETPWWERREAARVARFWKRADRRGPGECWPWRGSVGTGGYGYYTHRGVRQGAHRWAVLFDGREIPPGMSVLHSCDNPVCVNPGHLRVGTHAENMKEKAERDRAPKGVENPNAKLTPEDVQAIRDRYESGDESVRSLAAEFGVSHAVVHDVVRGRLWAHV